MSRRGDKMSEKELLKKEKQEVEIKSEVIRKDAFFTPDVDIYENDDGIILITNMPGTACDDVEIHVEENELKIQGKVVAKAPGSPVIEEYRAGNYSRLFALSDIIDQENIQASIKEGVLRVELPRAQGAKPKKIAVSAGQ